ncbi:MAG TPA: FAD-dependent monooxygenase [Ktedonobacterales bacterium]|nr:FAD-dependent monooxygenase [Ktedonobacterales bacterium]
MENRAILISGASVAGPALAYWLRHYGFNPTIVERASAPRAGGQAIDLRGAARDAAERMGIMPAVRQAHTGTKGMSFVNSAGKRVASMSADLLGNSGGAIAEIEILRGDLVRILYSATRDDVSYIFDDSITTIEQGQDGVRVTFEHGDQRVFALVVGADGLHSNVRALAFGAESAFVRDLGAYVATFTALNPLTLDDWELMYSTPGKTVGLYPLRQDTDAIALFYFASPPLRYDRHDIAQQKRLLADTFAQVGWEVPRLLEAMWEAPDFYFDRLSQVRMDHWSTGRLALLGDAAYGPSPLSGMGTSLALVGAYVLAGELAVAAGDHRIAFARYENAMRNYVEQGQKQVEGAKFGLLPRSYSQIRLRNMAWRMLPYMPWRGVVAGGARKAATAITLKDYEAVGVRTI